MLALLALTGLTFPMPVLGRTWTVDDDAGPGIDFTTMQAAIDAASPDDIVIVRPGFYGASTLTKALRVVGDGGPAIHGPLRVQDLPADALVVVSGLRSATGFGYAFIVTNCAGTVVAEELQAAVVFVANSADVRLRRNAVPSGTSTLKATGSRVEVVECVFRAPDGADQHCGFPSDPSGSHAAEIVSGTLHAARSSFQGGKGGNSTCGDLNLVGPGGEGGAGILLSGNQAQLLVTGVAANRIEGGTGGWSTAHGRARDGDGLAVGTSCSARVSGATIASASTRGSGSITAVTPDDPTLRLVEVPTPGLSLTLRLLAPPGSTATLRIGGLPAVVPVGGLEEDVLVARSQSFPMGVVAPSGLLGFNFPIPWSWPSGTTVFAQATLTYPGGAVRRTQSVPIVVR